MRYLYVDAKNLSLLRSNNNSNNWCNIRVDSWMQIIYGDNFYGSPAELAFDVKLNVQGVYFPLAPMG